MKTNRKDIFRKTLVAAVIGLMAGVCGMKAQGGSMTGQDIPANTEMESVKIMKAEKCKFQLKTHLDIPGDHPEYQKLLAGKLYGYGDMLLEQAFGKFTGRFKELKPDKSTDMELEMGTSYQGVYGRRFISYLYYVKTRLNNPKVKVAGTLPKDMEGMMTFDANSKRALTIGGIFTPEALKELGLENQTEDTELLIKAEKLIYRVTDTGGRKALKELALDKDNLKLFTDDFKKTVNGHRLDMLKR